MLTKGENTGELLAPDFFPRAADRYEGFEILPGEQGIRVAIGKPGWQPYKLADEDWVPAAELTFYEPEFIRIHLPKWRGSFQFRLRLERQNGQTPVVTGYRIGYHVGGSVLSYLLDLGLPTFFDQPVELFRLARSIDGVRLPPLKGIAPDKIGSIRVMPLVDGEAMTIGTLTQQGITLAKPIPVDRPARVIFIYRPLVDFEDGLYQVTEVPCVLIRLGRIENQKKPNTWDSVRLPANRTKLWKPIYLFDQLIEIGVIGISAEDCWAIGQKLEAVVTNLGRVIAPTFGLEFPIMVSSPMTKGVSPPIQGNVEIWNFGVRILGLFEGEQTTEIDVLN